MSTAADNKNDNAPNICAYCGKCETVKAWVKFCRNRECQIANCRERAAELHDEKIFKQPPPNEDCPICFMRMPCLITGYRYQTCCGKVICSGCIHAPLYDDQGNEVDNKKCAFCRTPDPTKEEMIEMEMKRADGGDAMAIHNQGCYYNAGMYGLPQDYDKALEFYHRAAELGHSRAYYHIGNVYANSRGSEAGKAIHYWELAAMDGDVDARRHLGVKEEMAGNHDRAIKHFMIAVRDGDSCSLKSIQELFMEGNATKDDYTKALNAYQTYMGEIKSDQRDIAAAANERYKYIE